MQTLQWAQPFLQSETTFHGDLTSTTFDVVLSIPHYEICSSDAHICTFGEGQNDQVKWELLMPPKPTAMHRNSHRCVAEVLNQWHDLPLCMHTVAVHRSLLAYIISCSFVSSLIIEHFIWWNYSNSVVVVQCTTQHLTSVWAINSDVQTSRCWWLSFRELIQNL